MKYFNLVKSRIILLHLRLDSVFEKVQRAKASNLSHFKELDTQVQNKSVRGQFG